MAKYIRLKSENMPDKIRDSIVNKKAEMIKNAKGRHISDEKTVYKIISEWDEHVNSKKNG